MFKLDDFQCCTDTAISIGIGANCCDIGSISVSTFADHCLGSKENEEAASSLLMHVEYYTYQKEVQLEVVPT